MHRSTAVFRNYECMCSVLLLEWWVYNFKMDSVIYRTLKWSSEELFRSIYIIPHDLYVIVWMWVQLRIQMFSRGLCNLKKISNITRSLNPQLHVLVNEWAFIQLLIYYMTEKTLNVHACQLHCSANILTITGLLSTNHIINFEITLSWN